MNTFHIHRINFLKKWVLFLTWILSVFGISTGNFGCAAYGPPGGEEEIRQLNDLKSEVEQLQSELNKKETEKTDIQKHKANSDEKIRKLEREADSLKILLNEFDK